MAEQTHSPDDLFPFAENLVRQLVKKHRLRWNSHRVEDAVQDLFLAGWQVWSDEGDVGLAKNRMVDRRNNLLRDAKSEDHHEPVAETDVPGPNEDEPYELESVDRSSDPVENAMVREYLGNLPERQRRIVLLRMAGYSEQDIADELGVTVRTIERELALIRKDYEHDNVE